MKLNELVKAQGSTFVAKRKGRGTGSGNGKTGGRGHKGQKARSGGGVRPGFEGGQMPLHRRLPKRGFNNIFAKTYAVINLSSLKNLEPNTVVDAAFLLEKGVINNVYDGLKVLGNGEITTPITVKAKKISSAAKEKIEAVGGKVEVI